MALHFVFDLLALLCAGCVSWRFRITHFNTSNTPIPSCHLHAYLLTAIIGLVTGSLLFGSLNLYLADQSAIGKSVLGGIAGAILATEIFKRIYKIRASTGILFIPGLTLGIVVGRIGCYVGGLDDYTYGTVTNLPWGIDFGDGVARHPVQLYESFSMAIFLLVFIFSFSRYKPFWLRNGFYVFVLVYAGQRFLWEFFKPYPMLGLSLNVFHILSLLLVTYAVIMMAMKRHYAS
ncbi:prolipoprotein diacylglyceryl transferase [Pseudomonadota bacterium]